MTLDAENDRLRAENAALRSEHVALHHLVAQLQATLTAAQARIAELEQHIGALEQQRPDPPSFVKPNRPTPPDPKPPRKKRASEHNHNRHCEPPTRSVPHALERCPDCDYELQGNSLDYRRQVIEIPEPQPVEVLEHQVFKRWCPHCRRWHSPQLDLQGQVLGQGRIGVRIISLIAYLRTTLRLPVRLIRAYLRTIHRLTLSAGEIVELLHKTRHTLQAAVDQLKAEARASPILHGDETGWREAGKNGYIWAFSTPGEAAVRYYEYDRSRGQAVLKRVLDGKFHGHLVSDFYVGYNDYAGKHQRCWTHLLRDLHALKEQAATLDAPLQAAVVAWALAVRARYDNANTTLGGDPALDQAAREALYVRLTSASHALGLTYAQVKAHPCQALAKRLLRHEDELFQFVLVPGLDATNNLGERCIRPLVVIRKISGGSRSVEGTKTRMALASLFGTWQARGLNPFEECFKRLSQTSTPA